MRTKQKKNKKNNYLFLIVLVIINILAITLPAYYISRNLSLEKKEFQVWSRISNIGNAEDFGENYKTVAWIKVPGTNIDYPVINSKDDLYDYPEDKERYAWITSRDTKYDDVVIVNGHNIFNLSSKPKMNDDSFRRFEALMSYVYYDFAKENQYIQFTRNGEDYVYKIFAVDFLYPVTMNAFVRNSGPYDKGKLKEQIKIYKDKSLYNYDVDVDENDKILTLVTCSRFFNSKNENKSFFVHARLVRENESMVSYNVEKNKNVYDEIEQMMEGDENEEE